MGERIWLSAPHMSGREQKYIREAFEENWIAPLGPNVNLFEKALEQYLSCNAVAAVSSGTAAMHLALLLSGVAKNDEVLCSTFTFVASTNPIRYIGANPVLIDSEEETWNLDPELLRKAVSERMEKGKKPKAIIVVHLYGMPARMEEILSIGQENDIPVIEDAAEALGSSYKGKKLGTMGALGVLSFNGNKIITTSGGGALITGSEREKQRAIFYSTQARDEAPHYQHSEMGYNYRMSNIIAGIGRGQIAVIDERVKSRRKIFEYYQSELTELQFLKEPHGFVSNRWLTTALCKDYEQRERIRLHLERDNIECRPLWKPMHLQPLYKDTIQYINGVSDDLFIRGLCLPSSSFLKSDDLDRIISRIKQVQ